MRQRRMLYLALFLLLMLGACDSQGTSGSDGSGFRPPREVSDGGRNPEPGFEPVEVARQNQRKLMKQATARENLTDQIGRDAPPVREALGAVSAATSALRELLIRAARDL